jgi:hypothetical protein
MSVTARHNVRKPEEHLQKTNDVQKQINMSVHVCLHDEDGKTTHCHHNFRATEASACNDFA